MKKLKVIGDIVVILILGVLCLLCFKTFRGLSGGLLGLGCYWVLEIFVVRNYGNKTIGEVFPVKFAVRMGIWPIVAFLLAAVGMLYGVMSESFIFGFLGTFGYCAMFVISMIIAIARRKGNE